MIRSLFAEHAWMFVVLVLCSAEATGCKVVDKASTEPAPQAATDGNPSAAGNGSVIVETASTNTENGGAGGSFTMAATAGAGMESAAGAAGTAAASDESAANANNTDASMASTAAMVDGPCAGHGDESFCAEETLHHCAANVEARAPETCMSAALCQVGAATGTCAVCIPGTFHCEGVMLNQCSDSGQYMLAMECPSAELCKEDAGACLDMQCMPNSITCSSDGKTLKTCNADGSEFMIEEPCEHGCNQALKMCNVCMPGAKSCSGSTLTTCTADGQDMEVTECMPTGGECSTSTCRNNACVPGVKPVSTACSDGKCDASGRCVACITTADCPDAGACNNKACTRGACVETPKEEGVGCGTGMICDGDGTCMEKPCGNGRLDSGESCDTELSSGCTSSCRWSNGVYVSCSSPGASCGSGQGWVCSPNGVCTHSCSTDVQCETESGNGSCLPFDGSGNNCAIECSGTRCPINGLPCNQWGPYNLCGTWSLMPGGQPMMGPN